MQAERIAGGVHRARTLMVNVYFVRDRTSGDWAVIDTGMPRTLVRRARLR